MAFLRGAHVAAHRDHKEDYDFASSMATTLGPSEAECTTSIADSDSGGVAGAGAGSDGSKLASGEATKYGISVFTRARTHTAFAHTASYYRDGAALHKWDKSLPSIAAFYDLEVERAFQAQAQQSSSAAGRPPGLLRKRRSSSAGQGSSLFDSMYPKGALRAPVTVLWGSKDQACTVPICLEGIGEYVTRGGSEVVLLPETGHWTGVERRGRGAVGAVLEAFARDDGDADGEAEVDVLGVVQTVYPEARLMVKR